MWGGSGVTGALNCDAPAAELCLDWSIPLVPPSMAIGADADDAAIVSDRVGYGEYFAGVVEPVGLVGEFLSTVLS